MDAVLTLFPTTAEHQTQLRESAPGYEFCFDPEEAGPEFLQRVTAVLGRPEEALLKKLPRLRLLQLNSAGVEPYATILPEHIALTNASGAYGPGIAEHALGMALMLMKKLHHYRDA